MMKKTYIEKLNEYNKINNSFKKKLIYHVGIDAGFHSEVDAMMECMLYCYINKIKFTIYADDANFSSGNGWNEFFESFCEENHDKLNKIGNFRYPVNIHKIRYAILQKVIKLKNKADFLTVDVFQKCIPRSFSQHTNVVWPLFGINGTIFDEYGKLADIALKYNDKTEKEVKKIIDSVNLPEEYVSIQLRGGDKILEVKELVKVDEILEKIEENNINIENLFVFTDDYRYFEEIKNKRPDWNVYTLANDDEKGYDNAAFNKLSWEEKRNDIVKMFAMIDICIASSLHLGYAQSCADNYIRSRKSEDTYFSIKDDMIE